MNWVTKLVMRNPAMKHLAKSETAGRNYGRIYAYDKYLNILNEGTEPLN